MPVLKSACYRLISYVVIVFIYLFFVAYFSLLVSVIQNLNLPVFVKCNLAYSFRCPHIKKNHLLFSALF